MPLRFRQSVSLLPGVRINLSKSGASVSLGMRGATLNIGSHGAAATFGLPGTGLSYRIPLRAQTTHWETSPNSGCQSPLEPPRLPQPTQPETPGAPSLANTEIRSAEVGQMTSASLADLKQLMLSAQERQRRAQAAMAEAARTRDRAHAALFRATHYPLKMFLAGRVPKLQEGLDAAQEVLETRAEELAGCFMRISFALTDELRQAWRRVAHTHDALGACQAIWDITANEAIDRVKTRSAACHAMNRTPVRLGPPNVKESIIAAEEPGIRFGNANGSALDFYPGLCLLREERDDFALVDMLDINLFHGTTRFIEQETVPSDSNVVGYAWEKSNKDGSPDRRFVNNRQFPIASYGVIRLGSSTGLNEAYMFSNPDAAAAFAESFKAFRQAQQDCATAGAPGPLGDPVADGTLGHSVTVPDPPSMLWYRVLTALFSLGAPALAAVVLISAFHRAPVPVAMLPGSGLSAAAISGANPRPPASAAPGPEASPRTTPGHATAAP